MSGDVVYMHVDMQAKIIILQVCAIYPNRTCDVPSKILESNMLLKPRCVHYGSAYRASYIDLFPLAIVGFVYYSDIVI